MGNTLLKLAKGWPWGEKHWESGSCLCVAFLGFQEKATGADPILNTGRGILA